MFKNILFYGGKNYEFDCFQNFTGARNCRSFGRDERGKNLMLDMLNSAPVTRICFHRFTGIYPSVSLPDYRHAAYFRYDIHACLDVFTVGRSVSSSDKHSVLHRFAVYAIPLFLYCYASSFKILTGPIKPET